MKIEKSGFTFCLKKNRWYVLYSHISKQPVGLPFLTATTNEELLVEYFEKKIGNKINSNYYLKKIPFVNGSKKIIEFSLKFTNQEIKLLKKLIHLTDKTKRMAASYNVLYQVGYTELPLELNYLMKKLDVL